jgi:hypothetical protein
MGDLMTMTADQARELVREATLDRCERQARVLLGKPDHLVAAMLRVIESAAKHELTSKKFTWGVREISNLSMNPSDFAGRFHTNVHSFDDFEVACASQVQEIAEILTQEMLKRGFSATAQALDRLCIEIAVDWKERP